MGKACCAVSIKKVPHSFFFHLRSSVESVQIMHTLPLLRALYALWALMQFPPPPPPLTLIIALHNACMLVCLFTYNDNHLFYLRWLLLNVLFLFLRFFLLRLLVV